MQSVDLSQILLCTVSLLLLCLWSSAFTDSLPTKRRERAQIRCPIFACACGERKQSVSLTHTSWFLDSFNFSHGKTLRSLLLSLSVEYVCNSIILLLFPFFSYSTETFQHLNSSFHAHVLNPLLHCIVIVLKSIRFSSFSLFESRLCALALHTLSLSAGVSLALGGCFAHSTKVSFLRKSFTF